MQFVDLQVPPRLAMGAQRKAGWSTTVVQTVGGYETTNQNWARSRYSFDLSFAVRTPDDYDAIVQHFHSVRGRAKKFPFKDFLDYATDATRGTLTTVTAFTSYTLAKKYGTGSDAYYRPITRPKSGSVAVFRTRSGTTTDITGSCTINTATGAVAISGGTVTTGDVLSWAGQFYVPVRYDIDELPASIPAMASSGDLLVECDNIPLVEVRE